VETILPKKAVSKKNGTIMFPTQHDITLSNVELCAATLVQMLEKGNTVLVVSKPDLPTIRTLVERANLEKYKDKVLFRFTIGSKNSKTLAFWEPGAPTYTDRLQALTYVAWKGFQTSVSMEPMLDTRETDIVDLVESLTPYVTDAIWLGKMNQVETRLKANGVWDQDLVPEMANDLMRSQEDDRIWELFTVLKDHPKVKWKNSIKEIVGLQLSEEVGLDV
jgi:DNA repair photolyase